MPPRLHDRAALRSMIPAQAIEIVEEQLSDDPIAIKIAKHRTSKSGDFRAPFQGRPALITINKNLNPYSFLITLVHELAHHHVWIHHETTNRSIIGRFKTRPAPHGKEWKNQFRRLMAPYLKSGVFPVEIFHVLNAYLENPKASSSADHHLSKALKNYDPPDTTIRLEELPENAIFTLHGRRTFRKKEKVRTRFRCICMKTNRIYLVSAVAPVVMVS